jgi:HemK-like putative methylase
MNDDPVIDPSGTRRMHAFMGVHLELGPGVLVPREETEILGRSSVQILNARGSAQVAIDMCCGCGNLAAGVASCVQTVRIWASDLTDETVAIARRNVQNLKLQDRIKVVQGDMFAALDAGKLHGQADLVMCNPPYISSGRLAGEAAHLLECEPREAFDGGPFGISIHQRLVREALPFLKPSGWLAFEFGEGQDRQAAALVARTGGYRSVDLVSDSNGTPRVALAQKF